MGSSDEPATFLPRDLDFESRVRDSFSRQRMMQTLGAQLASVKPGAVDIELPYRIELTQQNEFVHAAAIAAIADSACGYSAMSLLEPGRDVLSVEYKINLLAPAVGERFVASGRVQRSGRTLTVCTAQVHARQGANSKLIALMQATMIALDE